MVTDTAALVVTELSTNAVLHARSSFTVTIRATMRTVRIEVRDEDANSEPVLVHPLGESGRGLWLVDAIARRWGVKRDRGGKVVWLELGP